MTSEEKQCKINQSECDRTALKKLHDYQDKYIEHKDPFDQAAIEAMGDIFRTLTISETCQVFYKTYMKDKIDILRSYTHESGQDALEKCKSYMEDRNKYVKAVNDWHPHIEAFKKVIKETKMKDECRKELLMEIPDIQMEILKETNYMTNREGLKKIFEAFIKKLESRL